MMMMLFRIRNTTTNKNGHQCRYYGYHHRHLYHPMMMLLLLLSFVIFNENVTYGQEHTDADADMSNLLKDMDMSTDECQMFAQQGMCDLPQMQDIMLSKCSTECQEWKRSTIVEPTMETATIDDPDDFYNLSAKKYGYGDDDERKSILDFERFEGYITLIVNMALVCDSNHFDIEEPLKLIEHLHEIWPYNLEILFFPYRVTESNYYNNKDCTKDKSILTKFATSDGVHIMSEIKLNGPQTHPVYKFLKTTFGHNKIDLKHASYYFISPDANKVIMYHAINYTTLKKFVSKEMQNLQYIADHHLPSSSSSSEL